MLVFGTRPEAIKMCPLVNELKTRESIKTVVCVMGHHRQALDMVLDTFKVVPDYDLSMKIRRHTTQCQRRATLTATASLVRGSRIFWSQINKGHEPMICLLANTVCK